MLDDLTYLSMLAKNATKGNWIAVGLCVESESDKLKDICFANFLEKEEYEQCVADAAYIAAANPKVVLSLIKEVRLLRRMLDERRKKWVK